MNRITLIIPFLIFALHYSKVQEAINGVIDLSEINLNDNKVSLEGEWEFFWEDLISPDSIEFHKKTTTGILNFGMEEQQERIINYKKDILPIEYVSSLHLKFPRFQF